MPQYSTVLYCSTGWVRKPTGRYFVGIHAPTPLLSAAKRSSPECGFGGMRVVVYASSSTKTPASFLKAADELGQALAKG